MPRGRKENHSGTITHIPGRSKPYRLQVTVDGQRKSGGYYATMDEASRALRALTATIDNGTYVEPNRMTVENWMALWLRDYCVDIKASTKVQYDAYVRNHINPALGNIKLNRLQPRQVQAFINNLETAKKSTGDKKALTPKTIKNIHGCLSTALKQAQAAQYIRTNPATGCRLPKRDDVSSIEKIKPLDDRETAAFLAEIKDHRFENIYRMALYSGMRLSEILGLQWDHVNLETGDILIDRQLAMLRKKGETRRLTPTKTRNTRRITAPPSLCKMLLDQKNQQEEWKRKARASWNNDLGLVFTTETGESVPHASVEHQFTVVAKRAGLDNHVFHDLRHTFAVNALRAGIDIETISKLLGHFDPGFTLRVYADMTSDMRQSAAEKLQAMMEEREHPTQTPETSQPSEEGQIKNLLDSLV